MGSTQVEDSRPADQMTEWNDKPWRAKALSEARARGMPDNGEAQPCQGEGQFGDHQPHRK